MMSFQENVNTIASSIITIVRDDDEMVDNSVLDLFALTDGKCKMQRHNANDMYYNLFNLIESTIQKCLGIPIQVINLISIIQKLVKTLHD